MNEKIYYRHYCFRRNNNRGQRKSCLTQYVNDVKADWDQTNATEPNYIKNKPTIVTNLNQSNTNEANAIPTARAVKDEIEINSNTISIGQPDIDAADNRALIWVE